MEYLILQEKQYDLILSLMNTVFAEGAKAGGAYTTGAITEMPKSETSGIIKIFKDLAEMGRNEEKRRHNED